jgi:hypothetical protein
MSNEEIEKLLFGCLTYDQKREIEETAKATYGRRERAFTKVDPLALLKALDTCQDRLPPHLFAILRDLVEHHCLMSKDHVWENWELMSTLMVDKGLGWEAALKKASELTGKAKKTIRLDHGYVDKRIPPEFRRLKTHKKRR